MRKRNRLPAKPINMSLVCILAAAGRDNNAIIDALHVSRRTFYKAMARDGNRERLKLARANAERLSRAWNAIMALADSGYSERANMQIRKWFR